MCLCLFAGQHLGSILNKLRSTIDEQIDFFKQENSNLIFKKNKIIPLLFLFVKEQQG